MNNLTQFQASITIDCIEDRLINLEQGAQLGYDNEYLELKKAIEFLKTIAIPKE